MINILNFNNINKIKEYDRLSSLTSFRLWIDKNFNNKYVLKTMIWEVIITYQKSLFWIDWFMIWRIIELDWKRVFNLEYIHSFKKWIWTEMLLTYINKHKIKNILYLPNSWFEFWEKIKNILKGNSIVLKTVWEKVDFQ